MKFRIFDSSNFQNCLFTKMTFDNGKLRFQINCASQGFHVYRNIWGQNIGQNLVARQEVENAYDPFAMSVRANIPARIPSHSGLK